MSPIANARWPLKAAAIAGLIALVVVMAGAIACTVALAGLHRLSDDVDWLRTPGWLWYYRADPQVARWVQAGALAATLLLLLAGLGLGQSLRRPFYGKAHFASEAQIAAGGLRATKGIILGRANGRYLVFGGSEHVMLYAPTRTGKGVGVVIPNLLNWADSVVVLDVKRENWAATAGFRAAHGQTVRLFDPLAADGATARYNPLAHIARADPVATLDELQRIATMLFPAPPRGDPFWAEAARTGFIGVGAMVAQTPDLPFTLGEILRQLTTGEPKTRLVEVIEQRAQTQTPFSPGCVAALSDFCGAADTTFASIRQTLTSRLGLWLNPLVDQATAESDFDLRTLRDQRQSIYLAAAPENLVRIAPLYNLLMQQLVDLNTRRLPSPDQPGGQVLVLLDEFSRLGQAEAIAHGFSFVAGYGLRLLAVLQSPSQLRAQYGPDLADEIMTNCGVEVAFTPKDIKAAQTLSDRLGFFGAPALSRTRPTGFGAGARSVSQSEQRRALMWPQELLALPPDELLVLRGGVAPVRGRKIVYYRDKAFAPRLRPPPAILARPGATPQGPTTKPIWRAMTPDEISGRTPLTLDQLDPDDLRLPAGETLTLAQVEAWATDYLDRAAIQRPAR
jgi:type IV secretion system protein VirD4